MTVAVAYSLAATGRPALQAAVEEARAHGDDLTVLHVARAQEAHKGEAYRHQVTEEVRAMLAGEEVPWRLDLRTAPSDTAVNDVLVGMVDELGARMVVIGGRQRSPLGKALLGSTAQAVILGVRTPVLVIKTR